MALEHQRWAAIPDEYRAAIVAILERQEEFCREHNSPKSARAYRAAADALTDLLSAPEAKPVKTEKCENCGDQVTKGLTHWNPNKNRWGCKRPNWGKRYAELRKATQVAADALALAERQLSDVSTAHPEVFDTISHIDKASAKLSAVGVNGGST